MEGITDEEIVQLVDEIGTDNDKLNHLGLPLGFTLKKINEYKAENCSRPKEGTIKMFSDWKDDKSKENQRQEMAGALCKAKLTSIARKYFLDGKYGLSS